MLQLRITVVDHIHQIHRDRITVDDRTEKIVKILLFSHVDTSNSYRRRGTLNFFR